MIRNNKGSAAVLAVSVCLAIILVMCAVFEYMQMLIICTGIRDAVQSAVQSVVVANYDETYSQLREGYSGGFTYTDTGFTETVDTGGVFARLDTILALSEDGEKHTKYAGEQKEYSLSNLRVEVENTEFAQADADKNLNATVFVDVEVPVRFGGRELAPISFTMKVKASYIPKF